MRRRARRGHRQHEFGSKASPRPPDCPRPLSVKPRSPQAGAFSLLSQALVSFSYLYVGILAGAAKFSTIKPDAARFCPLRLGDIFQAFPKRIFTLVLCPAILIERFTTDDFTSPSSCWFLSDAIAQMAADRKPILPPNTKQVAQLIITIATISSLTNPFVIHRIAT